MKKLTARRCVRFLAQAISFVGALWGLMFFYIGVMMMELDWLHLGFSLFAFAFAACLIFTAYLIIWRYSLRSVKWFSFVAAFLLYSETYQLLRAYRDAYLEERMMFERSVTMIVSILVGVLLYFGCKAFLIKCTDLSETTSHDDGPKTGGDLASTGSQEGHCVDD